MPRISTGQHLSRYQKEPVLLDLNSSGRNEAISTNLLRELHGRWKVVRSMGQSRARSEGSGTGRLNALPRGGEGMHFGESEHLNSPAGVSQNCRSRDLQGETCLTCLKNGDQGRGWSRVRLRESEWG